MEALVVAVFILGYAAITMEHSLKIDKLIPALLMMAFAWAIVAFGMDSFHQWVSPHTGKMHSLAGWDHAKRIITLEDTLLHHFGKTAEILIFLMGAMVIVEMIDQFEGFSVIKKAIRTRRKITLLWIVCALAFVLSAIIDNLTATIVLITILRKIIPEQKDRLWFCGFVIIASNAGGAWTPIGDVTTTMLWMAGKVSTGKLMLLIGLPALVNILVPLFMSFFLPAFKGEIAPKSETESSNKYASLMFWLGLGLVIFVPVFKTITHLPPYIGMMLSLAIFALAAEILSKKSFSLTALSEDGQSNGVTFKALKQIEMPSILFFLGILMTVAAMESLGLIYNFGQTVNANVPQNLFITLLGMGSAVIDNVPLVAASIGMFRDAPDSGVWHFIAYAAGTGGSLLVIGSAAGVVAMGMEKISFFWYLKNISFPALLGYFAGTGVLLLLLNYSSPKPAALPAHNKTVWKTISPQPEAKGLSTYFYTQ
ncbi:MAG: sodium:proton antiporter [Crocinitomicaceae bacterium]|jgi:Na+/H+ antiporter NhaD/arsenite permease-like protein|nr:sodium:proton antiporter [Crocinitomicaceae bacterium]